MLLCTMQTQYYTSALQIVYQFPNLKVSLFSLSSVLGFFISFVLKGWQTWVYGILQDLPFIHTKGTLQIQPQRPLDQLPKVLPNNLYVQNHIKVFMHLELMY